MPYRKTVFVNDGIYHVINRGVNDAKIFSDAIDYRRFLELVDFLRHQPQIRFSYFKRLPTKTKRITIKDLKQNHSPLIDILAFGLMQNHFHLLLKQFRQQGIQIFMKNLQDSFAKYYNAKHKRKGPFFQSAFKAIKIDTDEQLVHISRYIHLNPVSSYIIEVDGLEEYEWSSFGDYVGKNKYEFVNSKVVLEQFKNQNEYKKFVFDQVDYQRELQKMKHLTIEEI